MKRIISAILILLMLVPTAFATAESPALTITVTGGNVTQVGETVTLTVQSKNAPACSSFRIFITYDDTVLECRGTNQLDADGMMMFNTESRYEGAAKVGVAAANASTSFEGSTATL